ncbi:MAG TPA: malto-oligosyltrehalose synthase [Steroidobacteraceae bacterium]|nr:malto-oligosyltrehalose synthase [Steroidobacteraceae bacterium]
MSGSWIATYRLQLHAGFPLQAAQEVLAYLADLGISHVYLSPCLQAVPGSQHGYDVVDPAKISEDLGGETAWSSFVQAARKLGLRILLDIVPNHMSASQYNPWWDDVLKHGPSSRFADFFDIRVPPGEPFCVHLCSLAKPYGAALEAGELTLEVIGGEPRVKHYENSWPLAPSSLDSLLVERAMQGDKESLDAILRRQYYLLHGWKLSGELTNYRRFFDIDSLIGIRVESPEVATATHARIQQMIAKGEIDGVRVDHPDGLREPLQYLERLRRMLPEGRIYIEKILENDERLKEGWPIDGTVGYEFLAKVNRLWMDDQRTDVLTATYADFTGHSVNFGRLVREKKRAILETTFAASRALLTEAALKIARAAWQTRDLSPRHLREALEKLVTALPVYRTYRTAKSLDEEDRRILLEALQSARIGSPEIDAAAFDFLAALFTKADLDEAEADFIAKWQQLTPAVMAKGVEDTMFYCFDRLVSGNEVGSQASLVGISADKFHEFCHHLSERWPHNMLATSTHDNKRSEDVRARISILSEIPERWSEALHQWSQLNANAWQNRLPDRHAEYLLYQTLIGAWPIDHDRAWGYMLKACREAKISTSWHEPNVSFEEKIRGFVGGVFESPDFIASLERFVEPLILPGRINSLAQTLIKLVAPGVPDFYQGTELWDLSLVDPDNRRPVDFAVRAQLLKRTPHLGAADALADWESGLPKLWMTARVLRVRRERGEDFSAAAKYQPLVAQGSHLGRLLAFRRGENLIAVVPRFTMTLSGEWGDTRLPLPGGSWRNCLTDECVQREVSPTALFASFPVALLVRDAS